MEFLLTTAIIVFGEFIFQFLVVALKYCIINADDFEKAVDTRSF
jgi:hypothetical protein